LVDWPDLHLVESVEHALCNVSRTHVAGLGLSPPARPSQNSSTRPLHALPFANSHARRHKRHARPCSDRLRHLSLSLCRPAGAPTGPPLHSIYQPAPRPTPSPPFPPSSVCCQQFHQRPNYPTLSSSKGLSTCTSCASPHAQTDDAPPTRLLLADGAH
jgi:hypothetical protein